GCLAASSLTGRPDKNLLWQHQIIPQVIAAAATCIVRRRIICPQQIGSPAGAIIGKRDSESAAATDKAAGCQDVRQQAARAQIPTRSIANRRDVICLLLWG